MKVLALSNGVSRTNEKKKKKKKNSTNLEYMYFEYLDLQQRLLIEWN